MRERHSELEFCGEYEGFILSVWVEDDKPVRFSRNNKRWRVIGWHYCKSGVVAESLFDIIDERGCCKVSDAEWKKAVGYVEDMASTLDAAAMSFNRYFREKADKEKKNGKKRWMSELRRMSKAGRKQRKNPASILCDTQTVLQR